MIHVASLAAFVKKAYSEKAFQTNMEKIISQLHLEPELTGMDMVVIAPKDLKIVNTKTEFLKAMKAKHHDIDVILVYGEEDEVSDLHTLGIVLKKVQRLNLSSIKEVLDEMLQERSIRQVESVVVSKDSVQPEVDKIVKPTRRYNKEPVSSPVVEPVQGSTTISEKKAIQENMFREGGFADWELFKQMLKKDSIIRELIQDNNRFLGTIEIMEILDKKISLIFKDAEKTAEERFEAIKEVALKRTSSKDEQNNIIVEKVLNIMRSITASAASTVEKRVNEIASSLKSFEETALAYYKWDRAALKALIGQRLDLQVSIHEVIKEITNLYQAMDETVAEVIADFDKNLPSENAYVNEIYASSAHLFVPENAAALAYRMMKDLQDNRIQLSKLEGALKELIAKAVKLSELDESIINQQNQLIRLLTSKNVEEVVIVDTLLKNCLRLYIGPDGVGTHATAITWAGILSRRHNTVLIDLTGSSKFGEYGIEAVSLMDFMSQRIEKQLLFVDGGIDVDMKNLQQFIELLKSRVNYYPYINIILSPKQTALINELSENAISATFISDCTNRGNSLIRPAIEELKTENIAKQAVLIDPPGDPLVLLNELTVDPLTYRLIVLPHISKMKSYSNRAIPPYQDREIVEIFEASFR